MRDGINYKCDDCGAEAAFKSYKQARDSGWGLKKDYITCWCPKHAPDHRHGNAKKAKTQSALISRRLAKLGIKGL